MKKNSKKQTARTRSATKSTEPELETAAVIESVTFGPERCLEVSFYEEDGKVTISPGDDDLFETLYASRMLEELRPPELRKGSLDCWDFSRPAPTNAYLNDVSVFSGGSTFIFAFSVDNHTRVFGTKSEITADDLLEILLQAELRGKIRERKRKAKTRAAAKKTA
jgi:hypothetical protein